MDDTQIEAIAERVAAKLRDGHVIPAVLPAEIGHAIRDAAEHRSVYWLHSIPLKGPCSISTCWTLMPDGGLDLELRNWAGETFWRGQLRPAAPEAPGG